MDITKMLAELKAERDGVEQANACVSKDLFSSCDGYIDARCRTGHIQEVGGTFMSQSSFILVLAILGIPVIAIYVTLFSVGVGFGDKAETADKTVPPAKTPSNPEPREIRHAA